MDITVSSRCPMPMKWWWSLLKINMKVSWSNHVELSQHIHAWSPLRATRQDVLALLETVSNPFAWLTLMPVKESSINHNTCFGMRFSCWCSYLCPPLAPDNRYILSGWGSQNLSCCIYSGRKEMRMEIAKPDESKDVLALIAFIKSTIL